MTSRERSTPTPAADRGSAADRASAPLLPRAAPPRLSRERYLLLVRTVLVRRENGWVRGCGDLSQICGSGRGACGVRCSVCVCHCGPRRGAGFRWGWSCAPGGRRGPRCGAGSPQVPGPSPGGRLSFVVDAVGCLRSRSEPGRGLWPASWGRVRGRPRPWRRMVLGARPSVQGPLSPSAAAAPTLMTRRRQRPVHGPGGNRADRAPPRSASRSRSAPAGTGRQVSGGARDRRRARPRMGPWGGERLRPP